MEPRIWSILLFRLLTLRVKERLIFEKENYESNSNENWDIIIEDSIAIFRNNNGALFNPYTQSGWNGYVQGTAWAWGTTEEVHEANVEYNSSDWRNFSRCYNPPNDNHCCWCNNDVNLANEHVASMWIMEQDIYYDVTWHWWQSSNNGGGFEYTRVPAPDFGNTDYWQSELASGIVEPAGSESVDIEISMNSNGIKSQTLKIVTNQLAGGDTTKVDILKIRGPQSTLSSNHFASVDTTSDVFYFVVDDASIDGYALETGDEVGLFAGDLCVGAGMYNGVFPFLVQAFGDPSGSGNGFQDGDDINVKAWDFSESRVATIDMELKSGSSAFLSGNFASASLSGTIYQTQEITILGGRFNHISTYLYPFNPASSNFFSNLTGLRICTRIMVRR